MSAIRKPTDMEEKWSLRLQSPILNLRLIGKNSRLRSIINSDLLKENC
nr:MAG TPA: hypothetical protein [Caudoviricetes sp.]